MSVVDPGLLEMETGVEDVNDEDPESDPSSTNTILQQLMSVATQPSPIKAVFSREELEVL
jgi:E3 ubiquitin-protein ligase HERC2